jgi:hypothetical protein
MAISIKITSLQDKQRAIARAVIETCPSLTKYHIVRASRQSGKTYLLERLAVTLATSQGDQSGAFIMATEAQTRKVFRSMIKWIPKQLIARKNNTNGSREIEFINGTLLAFFSSGSYDTIAGNSFDFLIGDEFGLWNRHAWGIIKPTLAAKPNAKVILASTPRGKNDFYKECIKGMGEDTFVQHYRMSYLDNSCYDLREIEDARKSMPDALFRQEYLAEFIDGISVVFGSIDKVQRIKSWPKIIQGEQYYFGLDISGDGEDKTVLTVVNKKGKVVLIHEVAATSHPDQARELSKIIKSFGSNIVGYGEKNGLGNSLCDLLIEDKITVFKWTTTNDSKQDLVSELITDINANDIELPTADLCPKLDDEMSMYMAVRTKTNKLSYTHPVGMHDDYVDSLMIANKARRDKLGTFSPVATEDIYSGGGSCDIYN